MTPTSFLLSTTTTTTTISRIPIHSIFDAIIAEEDIESAHRTSFTKDANIYCRRGKEEEEQQQRIPHPRARSPRSFGQSSRNVETTITIM